MVVLQVDARLPAARVQHDSGYAEPVGRLGHLEAQPVRVDEVADVGPGERHRLPDGGDRSHPARPEQAGTAERGLPPAGREHGDVVTSGYQAGQHLPGDVGRGSVARRELLGDQCDAHASTVDPSRDPAVSLG